MKLFLDYLDEAYQLYMDHEDDAYDKLWADFDRMSEANNERMQERIQELTASSEHFEERIREVGRAILRTQ